MWSIEYFRSSSGNCPVEEFIDSLDGRSRAKVARTLDLLEEFGVGLGMPYAKPLENRLWELRVREGRNRYRVIYFLATGRTFVLLHGFSKKTSAVSRKEIEIAERRREEYQSGRR